MNVTTCTCDTYGLLHLALAELGHPDRLYVLDRLADAPTATPVDLVRWRVIADADEQLEEKEIKRRVKAGMGALPYHVRVMAADGLIELARESRARSAIVHHYRLSTRGRQLHHDLLQRGGCV